MRNVTRILTVLALFTVLAFVNGPQVKAQTAILTESFENGGAIPTGWAQEWVAGTGTYPLTFVSTSTYPTISAAYNGTYYVNFNSFSASSGFQQRLKRTVALSTVNQYNLNVDFAWYMDPGYSGNCDYVQVQYSTNGTTWTNAGSQICRYAATAAWTVQTVALPAGAQGQATLYVAFLFGSAWGNNCSFDFVHVNATSPPPPPLPVSVTIGTGTLTTAYPFYNYWSNARSQFLYTAAEMTAGGGNAGIYNSIAFNVSNIVAATTMPGFTITMQNTTLTALPATFVSGGTVVYGPTSYVVPGTGWQPINFNAPFTWDGTSNILVNVCWTNPAVAYTNYQYVFGTANTTQESGYYSDPNPGCAATAATLQGVRANVILARSSSVGHLSGTITACYNSAPLAGATVSCGGATTTTSATGTFILWNAAAGAQNVVITAPGFVPGSFPVTIVANAMGTITQCLDPTPATVAGIVKDAANNQPITGAKLTFQRGTDAPIIAHSIAGGGYSANVLPAGPGWKITVSKAGFNDSILMNQNFVVGTTNLNWNLNQTANPAVGPAVAALNTGATAVNITWNQPTGFYEILYDNGVQTGYTVWAQQNNFNAVKFTAPAYPAKVIGGKVNVGKASNYATPPPTRPPFKMYLYDATGPNGTPGAELAASGDVVPTASLGWCDFTFTSSVTIPSGNYFIVMKQAGNNPNAYGLAIDTANSQYRSYSKYASSSGPWVPAAGNFMIRAICQGQGGPLHLAERLFINTQIVPGAIYETPLRPSSGYEGDGEVRGYDWANMINDRSVIANPPATKSSTVQTMTDAGQGVNGAFNGTPKELDNTDAVLFNNGPLVNSTGTGTNGADESVIQAPIGSYGWNINTAVPFRCADDFTVVGSSWSVTSFDVYTYQSNAPVTSCPITKAVLRIWNGQPGTAGATVVWGDTTTNRMGAGVYSNINRVGAVGGGAARAIWKITANTPGLTLNPGTYWAEWGFLGSASYSGPWGPPVTINNTPTTGNSIMFAGTLAGWSPIMGVTGPPATNPQGMPFNVNGTTSGGSGNIPFLVWRMNQGNEGNTATWTAVPGTPTTQTTITDNSWPSLADGAYRWAIKAQYPGNRLSTPIFTNVLGKNWVTQVTVNITLTCYQIKPAYCAVKLINTLVPDSNYLKVSDTTGIVVFPNVWKGNYSLQVLRMGFAPFTQNIDILGPTTVNVMLVGEKLPPTGLAVNNRTLHASWHPPRAEKILLEEDWSSQSFATNGWTVSGGNWLINAASGNPAPSLEFNYLPTQAAGYNEYVTSKLFPATYAPIQNFKYDILLDNFDVATSNSMAVEIWNGSAWSTLKTWDNQGGSIPWTTDVQDIKAYANAPFRVRFHAFGDGSYALNWWNIDNISIVGSDGHSGPNPCVIGYNFYLNNILSGFTPDTTYDIPPTQVAYGQTYNACVLAVYGSGYSPTICVTFVSQFLYPPREVAVTQVECSAYITWKKPMIPGEFSILKVEPRTEFPAYSDASPNVATIRAVAPENSDALWDVLFTYNLSGTGQAGVETDMPTSAFIYTTEYAGTLYHKYNIATGAEVSTFTIPGTSNMRDLTIDNNGFFYGSDATANLYKMDFTTTSLVATISTAVASGIRHIAFDPSLDGGNGGFWAGNWADMYAIKMNGSLIATGPATSGATYGSTYDAMSNSGHKYLWQHSQNLNSSLEQWEITGTTTLTNTGFVKNNTTLPGYIAGDIAGGLGAAKIGTKFALVGLIQNNIMFAYDMGTWQGGGGGGTPPGLIGYNVYRDDLLIHYVPSPDTLYYYDLNVDPGTHKWGVSAKYDLTPYGFPGLFAESLPAGNISMAIVCGLPLPFYEPWDNGSFTFQGWTFSPATQQHWVMNGSVGDPQPCADFKWDPPTANYSLSLQSPTLNAGPYSCAKIWLDFDYKCIDRNGGETEKLSIETYYSGAWHTIGDLKNNGTTANWMPAHIDISTVKGKGFRVRFNANGASSANILHWYVDNINVYGVCNSPLALHGVQSHDTIDLSWNAPSCTTGQNVDLIFDDGTYETQVFLSSGTGQIGNLFPVGPTMTGKLIQFSVMMAATGSSAPTTIGIFDNNQNLLGTTPSFTPLADTWVTVNVDSIPFTGQFYGMVMIDAAGFNGLALDQNGPFAPSDLTWVELGGAWQTLNSAAPGVFGPTVALVRAVAYVQTDLKSAVVGSTTPISNVLPQKPGLFYAKHAQGGSYFGGNSGVYVNNSDGSIVTGYNVYRTDTTGMAPFNKLNTAPVTVTNYTDILGNVLASYGDYKYYVTALYTDTVANAFLCESPSTDTIAFTFPAVGVVEIGNGQISVYPNPATENVNVKSDYVINTLEVMNYVGQTVYKNANVEAKTSKINVSNLQAGIYFVKVATVQGTRTVKITVTR